MSRALCRTIVSVMSVVAMSLAAAQANEPPPGFHPRSAHVLVRRTWRKALRALEVATQVQNSVHNTHLQAAQPYAVG